MQLIRRELEQHADTGRNKECGKMLKRKFEDLEEGIHISQPVENTQCAANGKDGVYLEK